MLIPVQREKILEVFMVDPVGEIHLREISRLSEVSLNNVNDTMRQFVKDRDTINILNKAKIDVSPLLEIRPISTTIEKFTEGLKKKTEFYHELWNDRIVFYNESLFWQLVREGNR